MAKPPAKPLAKHAAETSAEIPKAGDKAPAFALPRDGGGTVSLKDFAGK